MREEIRRRQEEDAKRQQQNQETRFVLNPDVQLDQHAFEKALMVYAEELKSQNKVTLATSLEGGETVLEHNKWIFTVSDDMQKNMLEREQHLLPYLRTALQTPDIFLEVRVEARQAGQDEKKLLTPEDKLRELSRQNPALLKLQEIFSTRIVYA